MRNVLKRFVLEPRVKPVNRRGAAGVKRHYGHCERLAQRRTAREMPKAPSFKAGRELREKVAPVENH